MFEWIDVTMLGLLVGLFGFNFGKSSSESKQESGLRGTEYFNDAAGRAASALADTKNLQSEINASDFGSFRGQRGEDMFNPGQFGLGTQADEAVKKMMSYSLGRMSAEGAGRGMLSPENTPGVAASATRQVLPQLLPQISQMAQWIYQLPEIWKSSLLQYNTNTANTFAPFLGAQGNANASGFNFGTSVGGDSMFPGKMMS